ncbi:hypothetical protein PCASD_08791 [Puccinia coronata f. sp. avenae]|nr:hypothetical protein PCASD_08791 [Puccinia coronata f. sp. avenae]
MLTIALYFISFLLFQSINAGPQNLLGRVAESTKTPKATLPPLTECPICLESLRTGNLFKKPLAQFRARRWPGCGHGYCKGCYETMVDKQTPCAFGFCNKPAPPLSAERAKYLKSLPAPPAATQEENNDEDIHATLAAILQTDIDLAENVPGMTPSGDAAFNPGTSHFGSASTDGGYYHSDDELSQAASLPHQYDSHHQSDHDGGASHGAGYYDDDEALVRALSMSLQQQADHHSNHVGSASSGPGSYDEDEALAMALSRSVQNQANHQSDHFAGSAASGAGYLDDDEAVARALSVSLQHEGNHHFPGHHEPQHSWGAPETSLDGDFALAQSIHESLNQEDAWSAPHASRDTEYARRTPRELYQEQSLRYRAANQDYPGRSSHPYGHPSSDVWPTGLRSTERGINPHQDTSLMQSVHDKMPQILLIGVLIIFYLMFSSCKK